MKRLLGMAVAVGVLAVLPVSAAPSPAAAPAAPSTPAAARADGAHPAVARIITPLHDGMAYGSGTLVGADDQHGLVVTNWHVVRDAAGPIQVVFPDGFRSPARVLKTDRDWDLAALAIWRPTTIQPVPISPYMPRQGEPLTIAGYGPGWYRAATGPCVEYVAPNNGLPPEMIEMGAPARQGDSGGPMFNSRGEVSGVLFGTGEGHTVGSYGGRVRSFLDTTLADFRRLEPNPYLQARAATAPATPQATLPTAAPVPRAAPLTAVGAALPPLPPPPSVEPRAPAEYVATLPDRSSSAMSAMLASTESTAPLTARLPASQPLSELPRTAEVASFPRPTTELPPATTVASLPAYPIDPTATPAASVSTSVGPADTPPLLRMISWTAIAGTTRSEQLKTILAAIGLLSITVHGLHLFIRPDPPKKKRR